MWAKRDEDLASRIVNVTEREKSCSWREAEVERGMRQVAEDGDMRSKEREQLNSLKRSVAESHFPTLDGRQRFLLEG